MTTIQNRKVSWHKVNSEVKCFVFFVDQVVGKVISRYYSRGHSNSGSGSGSGSGDARVI